MLRYTALLVVCVATAHAQVLSAGSCPDVQIMKDFDVTKYLGKWYEYARFFAIFEAGTKCSTANYTAMDNGVVRVENRDVNLLTGKEDSILGTATLGGAAGEGKLLVQFDSVGPFKANYLILKSDYTRFSVVFSCTNVLGLVNAEFAWILTRDKHPSDDIIKEAHEVMEKNHLNINKLHITQQDCDN